MSFPRRSRLSVRSPERRIAFIWVPPPSAALNGGGFQPHHSVGESVEADAGFLFENFV